MLKMSDELNEGVIMPKTTSDKPVVEEVIKPDVIAESSPASEDNHEQKPNGVQDRINTLTAKRYQETRRANDAEEALAKLKAQQPQVQTAKPQTEQLKAPVLPDNIYDEDDMRKYHTDSQAFNAQTATNAATNLFETQQQQSVQKGLDATHKVNVDKYAANATRDGVDFDKLLIAEQTLKQAGLSPELGSYLLNDNNGAKIVEYLNDNPAEMHEILQLDSVSAGIRIANVIKPKVLAQTPKVSGAPDPIPEVKGGGGYVEKDDFYKKYPGAVII